MKEVELIIVLLIMNLLCSVFSTWFLINRINKKNSDEFESKILNDNESYLKEIVARQDERLAFEEEVRKDPERYAAMQEMSTHIADVTKPFERKQ